MRDAGIPSAAREDSVRSLIYGSAEPTPRKLVDQGATRTLHDREATAALDFLPSCRLGDVRHSSGRQGNGAPLFVDPRYLSPAGASREVQYRSRSVLREHPRKAPSKERCRLYNDYQAHVEDHTFNKLHEILGRLERKAEREHRMLHGAAGLSSDQRQQRAQCAELRRIRAPSPIPGAGRAVSMAEILRDPLSESSQPVIASRASSPRLSPFDEMGGQRRTGAQHELPGQTYRAESPRHHRISQGKK